MTATVAHSGQRVAQRTPDGVTHLHADQLGPIREALALAEGAVGTRQIASAADWRVEHPG